MHSLSHISTHCSFYLTQLVDLVVSCGAEALKIFIENASRNAVYTSRVVVVDFIEALVMWSGERVLK